LISSASNDAIFELNFVTGKSWRNKVFREMLYEEGDNLSIKEKKNFVALQLHPDDKQKVIKV
jgi:hypothetical protein